MKDPYILNLSNLKESFIESELERAMIERIKTVLLELGNGFSFIGNQYKISVDDLIKTEILLKKKMNNIKIRQL